jgi:regulatory protein YycH of two-component signal transduction system YycFG
MKLDIKTVLPYLVLFGTILMTWGMWSERLNFSCYKSTNSSN